MTRRGFLAAGSAVLFPRLAAPAPAKSLRGAFMILSTPYTESKAVDYEDLATEVDYLDRCGVQGLVWPQLASEVRELTRDERMRGMEVIARAAQGRRPALMLGVQGDTTAEMLEYARHAEKLAPDAFIAIPPRQARSLDDYRQYFRALGKATSRPVFIQTSGGAPGLEPTVDFIVEMAREMPHLGHVKEEHEPVIGRMRELRQHRPDPIKIVLGAHHGLGWLYEMRYGADGTMTGTAMYADLYAQIWKFHEEKKPEQMREVFSKLLLMLNLDGRIPGVRPYMMKRRGVFKTTVSRRPYPPLTPEAIAEIEFNFAALKPYLKV